MKAQKHELKFMELVRQGKYTVTENGEIYVTHCWICKQDCHYRLSVSPGKDGYHRIRIRYNTRRYEVFVHRAVYTFFHGEIPDGMQINHIDGNRQNNALSNLEVVTPRENTLHAIHVIKTKKFYHGSAHPCVRLTPADVAKIIYYRQKRSCTVARLAARFGVSASHINRICSGEAWNHLFETECNIFWEDKKTGEKWKGIIFLHDQQPKAQEK